MAIAEPQTTSKKEDDEISLADSDDMGVDDDAAFALPPTKIEIDPSTGIKTVTEYRVKEDGSKVRSIKRVKVHKVSKTVTKDGACYNGLCIRCAHRDLAEGVLSTQFLSDEA